MLPCLRKCQTTFQIFRNQSDWLPEQPRNSPRHYSNLENKSKYFFRIPGHQILTEGEQNHLGRKSSTATMKSLWKLLALVLWVQDNFAGLATALKHVQKLYNMAHPPHPPRPQVPSQKKKKKIDINKTYFPTGKTRYNRQIMTQPRLKINLLKIPTTKDTRSCI